MGEAAKMLPIIAKQKRQRQRLKANNAQLAEKLDETETELEQAIETANWNYECAQKFLNRLKDSDAALQTVKESRDRIVDQRDHQYVEREAWKRAMAELFNERKISVSREEIDQRQAKHAEKLRQKVEEQKAEKEKKKAAG